jgi:hypothetical protein
LTHFVLLDIVENVIVLSNIIVLVPKWVLQGKNFAAQFFIEKYLCFHGGDFATPLLAKCLY